MGAHHQGIGFVSLPLCANVSPRTRVRECEFLTMNTFPDPLHKCNFHDTICPNMALTLSRSSALTVEPSMPAAASVATTSSRASGRGGEDDVPAVGCFREVVLLARLRLRLLLRLLLLERRRRWWGLLERRRLFCLGLRSRSLCRDLPRSLRLLSLCLSWLERIRHSVPTQTGSRQQRQKKSLSPQKRAHHR